MTKQILISLIVAASFWCTAAPPGAENHVAIGQPTIFWHNGQWQTYKNGVWTPYGKTPTDASVVRTRAESPAATVGPSREDPTDAGISSGPNEMTPARRHRLREKRAEAAMKSAPEAGEPAVASAQTSTSTRQSNVSIGQPNVGIGRTTIGIGRPNIGIGPPAGIGQTATDQQQGGARRR